MDMPPPPPPLFLDAAAVARLVREDELLQTIRQVLVDVSLGRVTQPLRSVMETGDGLLFLKPVCLDDVMAVKAITQFPGNAARGLPTMLSTILLMDAATGAPLAAMDGGRITALRTAAASAVAADALTPAGEKTVAILGSGVLARSHAKALRAVRPVRELRIWSPTAANARQCAADVGGTACASAREAVEGADIVCTVTNATTPVVHGAWLVPGAFVAAVGAPRPGWRELDDELMRSVVIADSREAALSESGDVILSGASVYAEIGEVLAGRVAPPPAGSTIVFKSLGLAAEDAAAARLVHRAALAERSSRPS